MLRMQSYEKILVCKSEPAIYRAHVNFPLVKYILDLKVLNSTIVPTGKDNLTFVNTNLQSAFLIQVFVHINHQIM